MLTTLTARCYHVYKKSPILIKCAKDSLSTNLLLHLHPSPEMTAGISYMWPMYG